MTIYDPGYRSVVWHGTELDTLKLPSEMPLNLTTHN